MLGRSVTSSNSHLSGALLSNPGKHRTAENCSPQILFGTWWLKNGDLSNGIDIANVWEKLPFEGSSKNDKLSQSYWIGQYSAVLLRASKKKKLAWEEMRSKGDLELDETVSDSEFEASFASYEEEQDIELWKAFQEFSGATDSSLVSKGSSATLEDISLTPPKDWTEYNLRVWLRRSDREATLDLDPVLLSITSYTTIANTHIRKFLCLLCPSKCMSQRDDGTLANSSPMSDRLTKTAPVFSRGFGSLGTCSAFASALSSSVTTKLPKNPKEISSDIASVWIRESDLCRNPAWALRKDNFLTNASTVVTSNEEEEVPHAAAASSTQSRAGSSTTSVTDISAQKEPRTTFSLSDLIGPKPDTSDFADFEVVQRPQRSGIQSRPRRRAKKGVVGKHL